MLGALRRPDLPEPLRQLAKKALDHLEVLLGLQDAQKRAVRKKRS
jgi:hypothetical protein